MENISLYHPRTMFEVVRRMPPVHTFFRSIFFKNRKTFYTDSVDVDYKKGGRQLAPFVHPTIGGKTLPNRGFSTKNYTPPLVAPNKVTTADRLLSRLPGEHIYSGMKPAQRAVQHLREDFDELYETIYRREEWMAAQVIMKGQLPIVGEGVSETIDFQHTNREDFAVAGPKWKKDKLGYIKEIKRKVQKTGFVNCDICLMADDVVDDFINDEKIQKLLHVKDFRLAEIAPKQLPHGVSYIGSIKGEDIDIYTYNEWFLDDWTDPANPVEKPLVTPGTLTMLSTAAKFSIYYGALVLLDDKGKWVDVPADKAPETWIARQPSRRFVQLSSRPLTVPHEVEAWHVSQVLDAS